MSWSVEEGFRGLDAIGSSASEFDVLKELEAMPTREIKKQPEAIGASHPPLLHPVIAHPGIAA
jgi:hypothetical protein